MADDVVGWYGNRKENTNVVSIVLFKKQVSLLNVGQINNEVRNFARKNDANFSYKAPM
jgi:hypothetical protein